MSAGRGRAGRQSVGLDIPNRAITFDVGAFDEALADHGVQMRHWRAMRCPVGLVDRHDQRRHVDHAGCSNGFIYTDAGLLTCLFTGNSLHVSIDDPGVLYGATVQVTFRRTYDECPGYPPDAQVQIMMAPFDRLYLDEEVGNVVTWETFEHHASGLDKLKFPVEEVVDVMDADGIRYETDTDFKVRPDGRLEWIGSRPAVPADTEKGKVCSIRYHYRPFFYVKNMIHEIRVAQGEEDFIEGKRKVMRMPQSAVLQREYIFESQENDPEGPGGPRQQKEPRSMSFGPR